MNTNDISTKDQIREISLQLFKEYSYDNVTIMQICKAAKITKRTFYYHYSSKADLLSGVVDFLGMKAEKLLLSMATQKKNVDILWDLMSVYCKNSQEYGPYIMKQVYIHTLQDTHGTHFPEDMHLYKIAVKLIENAQVNKEIYNTSSPEIIAFSLYHTLRSVTMTWASENGERDLINEFKNAFHIVLGYDD